MRFEFRDASLEQVYFDPKASLGHGPAVNKGFRKVMNRIDAAHDERDLRELKGLHYEKLKGNRSHQHSLKITDQWRLVVERVEEGGITSLLVISVEDYH